MKGSTQGEHRWKSQDHCEERSPDSCYVFDVVCLQWDQHWGRPLTWRTCVWEDEAAEVSGMVSTRWEGAELHVIIWHDLDSPRRQASRHTCAELCIRLASRHNVDWGSISRTREKVSKALIFLHYLTHGFGPTISLQWWFTALNCEPKSPFPSLSCSGQFCPRNQTSN